MSIFYQGHDPFLTIINNYFYHARKKENAKVFNNFNHSIKFKSIVEDVITFSSVKTEYENHTIKCYVIPNSNENKITFYNEEQIVEKKKLSEGDFIESRREFPKKTTSREIDCRCKTGILTCPNCKTTKIVTCPECFKPRSGKCKECRGIGQVRCQECRGTGTCTNCRGRGDIRCSGCGGKGFQIEYRIAQRSCASCGSLGYRRSYGYESLTCYSCNGTGYREVREPYEVSHDYCNGTGLVDCDECSASGRCSNCDGTGNVTCEKCDGDGLCTFCHGDGTKTCPTCIGKGQLPCPICVGNKRLILYSSDIFEYNYTEDSKNTLPNFYNYSNPKISNFAGCIKIANLEDSTVEKDLGLMNAQIATTLQSARSVFSGLLETATNREFSPTRPNEQQLQDKLYSELQETLDKDWSRGSDNFNAKFLTNFTKHDRELDYTSTGGYITEKIFGNSDHISRRILFQQYNHIIVPISVTSFEIDNKAIEILGYGTKDNFELSITKNEAKTDFSSDLKNLDSSRIISPPSIEEKPSKLRSFFTLGTQRTRKITKLVTIIGDDEILKLTIFTMFGTVISKMNLGQINDQINTQITSCFLNPSKYGIGSSSACSVEVDEHKSIVLVNVHSSSFENFSFEVKRIIKASDLVIYVLKNYDNTKNKFQDLLNLDPDLNNKLLVVTIGQQVKNMNLNCFKTVYYDIEQINKQYLTTSSENIFSKTLLNRFLIIYFLKVLPKTKIYNNFLVTQ